MPKSHRFVESKGRYERRVGYQHEARRTTRLRELDHRRRQGSTESHAGFQAARFFTVSVVGLGVNLAVLAALVDGGGMSELPAQAIAVVVATPVNFIGNKLWTFDR